MESASVGTVLTRLSVAQWAIGGAALLFLLIVLLLNCCHKTRRWRAVQEARSGLVCADFLTLRDLSKHAHEIISKEAKRERSTTIKPAWRDDCGWGRRGSEYEGVHFKTFIGSSLHVLEWHACRRDASLSASPRTSAQRRRRREGEGEGDARGDAREGRADEEGAGWDFGTSELACDVEDYLRRVRVSLDGDLDGDLCAQYLAFYRNARTAGRQCTEQEYRSFLGVFQEMLRRIEP